MSPTKLAFLIYIMAAPTVAGAAMVAVLTMRGFTTQMLVAAGLAGFVAAMPVAWLVARSIGARRR